MADGTARRMVGALPTRGPDMGAYSCLWEFVVPDAHRAAFERHYGPAGAWARLFARADGYLGTSLLADATAPGRYLTLDRWQDEAAFRRFRQAFAQDYARLDRACEALTSAERALGTFIECTR